MELLTHIASGERRLDGSYLPDSVFGRAAQRLKEMAQVVADGLAYHIADPQLMIGFLSHAKAETA